MNKLLVVASLFLFSCCNSAQEVRTIFRDQINICAKVCHSVNSELDYIQVREFNFQNTCGCMNGMTLFPSRVRE